MQLHSSRVLSTTYPTTGFVGALQASLNTAIWLFRDPHRFLFALAAAHRGHRWMELYGPASGHSSSWRIERKRVLFAWDVDLLSQAFRKECEELAAGAGSSYLKPYLGESSLFVLDGEPHRQERKVYGAALKSIKWDNVDAHLQWALDVYGREPVPLVEVLHRAMLETTLDALLPDMDTERRRQFAADILLFVESMTRPGLFFPRLARASLLGQCALSAFRAQHRLQASLSSEWQRMQTEAVGEKLCGQVDRQAWIDRMLTLIISAFESTATVAAWTLLELYRSPAALNSVKREVHSMGAASPLLHLALLEALRMHPPTPIVVRRCVRPMLLGDVSIDTDDYVVLAIAVVHRNPLYFTAPDEFQAERFSQIARDGELPYYPFGGGIRSCVGQGIAMKNLSALVAGILERGPWQLAGNVLPVVRNLTYAPPAGLRLEPAGAKPGAKGACP